MTASAVTKSRPVSRKPSSRSTMPPTSCTCITHSSHVPACPAADLMEMDYMIGSNFMLSQHWTPTSHAERARAEQGGAKR